MARAGGNAKKHAGSTAWKLAGVCDSARAGGTARELAGSTAWTSAGSTAENLDRPIVRVLGVRKDGKVSR